MALKGKYKDTALFKGLSGVVPKGRIKEARAFAAKFGVKKHATEAMGQHDTLEFVGALEKKHLLKHRIGGLPTYGSTKKEILEAMTGEKTSPADQLAAAAEARRKLKEEQAGKMQAKTASEAGVSHPKGRPEDKARERPLTKAQKAANVVAGRESQALGEAEREKQLGKLSSASAAAEGRPKSGGVTLATDAIVIPKHEEKPPADGAMSAVSGTPEAETPKSGAPPAQPEAEAGEAEPAAPLEPGDPSKAIDIGID